TEDRVGAVLGVDLVIDVVARQVVGPLAADDVLERGRDVRGVALGVATGEYRRRLRNVGVTQDHQHPDVVLGVVQRVVAAAVVHRVAVGTALDGVVAATALDGVGAGVAVQHVGTGGPAGATARRARADRGPVAPRGVGRFRVAVDDVGTAAAVDGVAAATAVERIGKGARAGDGVVAVIAVDFDAGGGVGAVDVVGTGAALDHLERRVVVCDAIARPGADDQEVRLTVPPRSRAARRRQFAGVAAGDVRIILGAAREVLGVGEHQILVVAAVHAVLARPAVEGVVAFIAVERVVAGSAIDAVVAGTGGHAVVAATGGDVVVAGTGVNGVVALAAGDGVVVVAGVDDVAATAAIDDVVADT